MGERADQINDFLNGTPFRAWQRTAIAGDASARRYLRLSQGDQRIILMDDPAGATQAFASIARHLRAHGLAAPDVLAHDPDAGLMLLDDLGNTDIATTLRTQPEAEQTLYQAATDALIHLRTVTPPPDLPRLTPEIAADMIGILGDYYTNAPVADLQAELKSAMADHAAAPTTLALRDYHAENLIWRPDRQGLDRIGLLDFQDAFVAPDGYDLASLLRDARRDVTEATVTAMLDYYIAETGARSGFRTQIAVLGAQRNLRILGVFARLAREAGKTRYLAFMPRVWDNILRDLADPALTQLQAAVQDVVPAPTTDLLTGLRP